MLPLVDLPSQDTTEVQDGIKNNSFYFTFTLYLSCRRFIRSKRYNRFMNKNKAKQEVMRKAKALKSKQLKKAGIYGRSK